MTKQITEQLELFEDESPMTDQRYDEAPLFVYSIQFIRRNNTRHLHHIVYTSREAAEATANKIHLSNRLDEENPITHSFISSHRVEV